MDDLRTGRLLAPQPIDIDEDRILAAAERYVEHDAAIEPANDNPPRLGRICDAIVNMSAPTAAALCILIAIVWVLAIRSLPA